MPETNGLPSFGFLGTVLTYGSLNGLLFGRCTVFCDASLDGVDSCCCRGTASACDGAQAACRVLDWSVIVRLHGP
jgi:hypothetical protein